MVSNDSIRSGARTPAPVPRAILTSLASAAAGPAFIAAGWAVDARVSRATPANSGDVMRAPAKLIVVFGRPWDVDLFEFHYQVRHLELVLAMPHYTCIVSALVAGDTAGKKSSYHWVTTIRFSSMSDMIRCLSSPDGQAALADITTFATGGATARILTGRLAKPAALRVPPGSETAPHTRHEQPRPGS